MNLHILHLLCLIFVERSNFTFFITHTKKKKEIASVVSEKKEQEHRKEKEKLYNKQRISPFREFGSYTTVISRIHFIRILYIKCIFIKPTFVQTDQCNICIIIHYRIHLRK